MLKSRVVEGILHVGAKIRIQGQKKLDADNEDVGWGVGIQFECPSHGHEPAYSSLFSDIHQILEEHTLCLV